MTPPRLRLLPLALLLVVGIHSIADTDAATRRRTARPAARPAPPAAPVLSACTDFYTFQHQDWLKTNPFDARSGITSALRQLVLRSRVQQIDLLNAALTAPAGVPKLLGDFWASGLDEAAVEADGARPIAPLLDRISAIRRSRDVAPAIAALHQVGIPVLFNFDANLDLSDPSRHVGWFSQGGLGLVDPAWYTRTDEDSRRVYDAYRKYVRQIMLLTGSPADKAEADAAAALDIEARIATISRSAAQMQDPRANYALVPVAGLRNYRNLQLQDFLKAQAVNDDVVSLADAGHFAQLDAMVAGLPAEQWKAYLRYHVGAAMAPYLSRSWREVDFAFRGRLLRGQADAGTRQEQVLDAMTLAAGPMLGHEYVARYLPAASRSRAEAIAEQVRAALVAAVDRNGWMSAPAKTEAKAKLADLKIEVGMPRRDLDYTIQPMGRGSFGGNMLIASTWRHREEMRRIGRGNADRRWDVLPQQPALAYDLAHNRLIITAAMLQAPVLDMGKPAAAHYGSLGALIGHELTHAIDARGRQLDAQRRIRDWWTAQDLAGWQSRGSALATQFNAYLYPDAGGAHVNGALVREQALAGLSGLELAMDALRATQPGPVPAPFFEAWAALWPEKMSVDVARLTAATSPNPPGQWRTNGLLRNLPEFAAAFSCRPGQPMTLPAGTAPVRVWN